MKAMIHQFRSTLKAGLAELEQMGEPLEEMRREEDLIEARYSALLAEREALKGQASSLEAITAAAGRIAAINTEANMLAELLVDRRTRREAEEKKLEERQRNLERAANAQARRLAEARTAYCQEGLRAVIKSWSGGAHSDSQVDQDMQRFLTVDPWLFKMADPVISRCLSGGVHSVEGVLRLLDAAEALDKAA